MPTASTVRAAAVRDLRPDLAAPVERTAVWARAALAAGLFDLPLPGRGATGERFAALADLGGTDLDLARLAEAHVDAAAIRADLGAGGPADGLWGVWAANPPADPLLAHRCGGGWRLDGSKPWCSGAGCCDRALVTARPARGGGGGGGRRGSNPGGGGAGCGARARVPARTDAGSRLSAPAPARPPPTAPGPRPRCRAATAGRCGSTGLPPTLSAVRRST